MTETNHIIICPRLQQPCRLIYCAHCAHSVKLGETWWCAWKEGNDD